MGSGQKLVGPQSAPGRGDGADLVLEADVHDGAGTSGTGGHHWSQARARSEHGLIARLLPPPRTRPLSAPPAGRGRPMPDLQLQLQLQLGAVAVPVDQCAARCTLADGRRSPSGTWRSIRRAGPARPSRWNALGGWRSKGRLTAVRSVRSRHGRSVSPAARHDRSTSVPIVGSIRRCQGSTHRDHRRRGE